MDNTIEKRQSKNKEQLLEILKKTPIVQIACEKAGVSRATYYRWRKDNSGFSQASDQALLDGSLLINDMAESQMISAIKDKNMTAIIFWLKTHHDAYRNRVEVTTTNGNQEINLTDEQKELLNKAIEMAALIPPKENSNE
ncbi:MAG: hypothetical protein UX85_C0007G0035 [Candidatus Beckwithbacteria bacterium GW2011_GWB1_47_15]|uniref:Homeodomain phBC6A51-type domain-containing protein n=1 Tax=Candidatus Beckwithbacteria bacterium GW2011_GWB1_47_15 TaxID=1618371 RepID=A0A0G1U342_9BACT|nr:MAG: hypothetical protein UX50_C0006G0030 [Candidatus Beckwithbacteria bacterium GW2011_GWA1_46_30]KKU60748.1 MAG: hypothetical protein UX85_C0007G0035 [Candidatus Beckwithbacteria bacterium GW2011_GWB1_47_15]KKU71553.1 MAG: hypothetical protein UX97_C0005G0036 [Candidatus Beckwithbacteria bacterium GW2011_GWA2_47_25]KKW03494.1 MAG: hypothetical protein UY37_C0005G0057 [Candidatus Beckwithbacteria bacterium GW2011_GWC2_49_11]OGD49132.1 MAG: hypothetical protein A2877_00570 [Candidatus Beckwi